MPAFSNIDGEESASVTFTVGAISLTRNSSAELQEILCIGDPETASSLGLARVLSAAPASTNAGLGVRIISGPSSVADFAVRAVLPSTSADNPVTSTPNAGSTWPTRPLQSSAADLQMTATPAAGSTWNVRPLQSSAADLQMTATPAAGSTWSVRPLQSSAADLLMTATIGGNLQSTAVAAANSSAINVRVVGGVSSAVDFLGRVNQGIGNSSAADEWSMRCSSLSTGHVTVDTGSIQVSAFAAGAALGQVSSLSTGHVTVDTGTIKAQQYTSSGGAVEGSTTTPAAGVLGLLVRPAFPTPLSTTVNITSTNSTAFYTLIDAAGAGVKNKVFAYFVGSTHTIPSTGEFISSTSAPKWAVNFGSGSSGITGANLAVSPPGYLFETAANTSLTFRCAGNSSAAATTVLRVSISYFQEA